MPPMKPNRFNYHELLSTVPDALLTQHGYLVKDDCNSRGRVSNGAVVRGSSVIFRGKFTELESDFDAYVVFKNKNVKWAKAVVESAAWRT